MKVVPWGLSCSSVEAPVQLQSGFVTFFTEFKFRLRGTSIIYSMAVAVCLYGGSLAAPRLQRDIISEQFGSEYASFLLRNCSVMASSLLHCGSAAGPCKSALILQ